MNDEKFTYKAGEITRLTNRELLCKDCKFRYDDSKVLGNTSRCEMYKFLKPIAVLEGHECPLYSKE